MPLFASFRCGITFPAEYAFFGEKGYEMDQLKLSALNGFQKERVKIIIIYSLQIKQQHD